MRKLQELPDPAINGSEPDDVFDRLIAWLSDPLHRASSSAAFTNLIIQAGTDAELRLDGMRDDAYPSTAADLCLCFRLLEALPELAGSWEEKLARLNPGWEAVTANWEVLRSIARAELGEGYELPISGETVLHAALRFMNRKIGDRELDGPSAMRL